jgi:predicted ester cyclase
MELRALAHRHLDAWNHHDPDEIAATAGAFAAPDAPERICGNALRRYAETLLNGLGDLRFEAGRMVGDDSHLLVPWTLEVAHRGRYLGIPPTGATARIGGTDEVVRFGGGIAVTRVYDRLALAEALGLRVRIQPPDDPAREFGASTRVRGAGTGPPGALVVTRLRPRDEAQSDEVDQLSVEIIRTLRASRRFLGTVGVDVGEDKYTISAFENLDAVSVVHGRAHQRAVRRMFRSGLTTRALTSVWAPVSRREYVRCPTCGTVERWSGSGPSCQCGWQPEPEALL